MTIDYTIPDSSVIREAVEAANIYRSLPGINPPVAQLAAHIDLLVEQLREVSQAHAESLEAYQALRKRVRDAVEVDDCPNNY